MNSETNLKKRNDDLMAQLQIGLAELKTTVRKYPEISKKVKSCSRTPKNRHNASIYENNDFSIKEIKDNIKLRRSSRNTSTPKLRKPMVSAETVLSKNDLPPLILDSGNLRPGKKQALGKADKITPIKSARFSNSSKIPLEGTLAVNTSSKSHKVKQHYSKQLRYPKKVKTDFNGAKKSPGRVKLPLSKYLKTPENCGNIKSTQRANLNHFKRKSPMKSILQSKKIAKTPNKGNRVCFSAALDRDEVSCEPIKDTIDTTMMGYDWIAGMLDNDASVNDRSDNFFNELKEFRKANWNDCKGIKSSERNSSICQQTLLLSPALKHSEKENYPLCCKGNGAYMVDDRLKLVPIHGPYSACPSCESKPISQSDPDGYVRVSIPRSTIKSPYKLHPHRRKSFDPSDSVALSMHCLAGWQASKPACIRGPSNVDLGSHIAKPGLTSVKAVKGARFRY